MERSSGEIIEAYLSEKGSANIKKLARMGEVSEDLARSIADGLVHEGKARSYVVNGSPVYEWTGT